MRDKVSPFPSKILMGSVMQVFLYLMSSEQQRCSTAYFMAGLTQKMEAPVQKTSLFQEEEEETPKCISD